MKVKKIQASLSHYAILNHPTNPKIHAVLMSACDGTMEVIVPMLTFDKDGTVVSSREEGEFIKDEFVEAMFENAMSNEIFVENGEYVYEIRAGNWVGLVSSKKELMFARVEEGRRTWPSQEGTP